MIKYSFWFQELWDFVMLSGTRNTAIGFAMKEYVGTSFDNNTAEDISI
jgi:hypothetical protein